MTDTGVESRERAGQFSLDVEERSIKDAFRDWLIKLRTGDPGALPSVLGLVVLAVLFSQVSAQFLTSYNIGNLPTQGAYIGIIALGLVFVLILGEIDLSAGTAGGTAAAIAASAAFTKNIHHGLPGSLYWSLLIGLLVMAAIAGWQRVWLGAGLSLLGAFLVVTNLTQHVVLALVAAICIGAAIGVFNGLMVAKVGIPSFVVTLALFLAWQGVLQFALRAQPVAVGNFPLWHNLAFGNLSVVGSWVFTLVLVIGYLAYTLLRTVRARRAGLARDAVPLVLARGGALALVAVVVTALATRNRNTNPYQVIEGIPVPAAICIVLMILCTILLSKTTWGRHLYATGGNEAAAHRAGIDVARMKITAFTLCSAFGAMGGVMLASYISSASLDLGSGNVLLFSVAAAVIGGTSLFGGRGKPRDAIIGALVIAIIPNGILLSKNLGAQWQQVITGVVLLLAAAVDAVSRRRAKRS